MCVPCIRMHTGTSEFIDPSRSVFRSSHSSVVAEPSAAYTFPHAFSHACSRDCKGRAFRRPNHNRCSRCMGCVPLVLGMLFMIMCTTPSYHSCVDRVCGVLPSLLSSASFELELKPSVSLVCKKMSRSRICRQCGIGYYEGNNRCSNPPCPINLLRPKRHVGHTVHVDSDMKDPRTKKARTSPGTIPPPPPPDASAAPVAGSGHHQSAAVPSLLGGPVGNPYNFAAHLGRASMPAAPSGGTEVASPVLVPPPPQPAPALGTPPLDTAAFLSVMVITLRGMACNLQTMAANMDNFSTLIARAIRGMGEMPPPSDRDGAESED